MEKKGIARKYELMTVVNAKLSEEEKQALFKEIASTIEKAGGRVINSQVWIEKHKLTFDIKKCSEGTYYLVNFDGASTVNKELETLLKINERILRFVIIKAD